MWPDLSQFPSFRHRLATQDDINAGQAAFLVPGPGGPAAPPMGTPMKIDVPQYAYHLTEGGIKVPGVLIQAVQVGVMEVGAIMYLADGKFAVATMNEFELLGTSLPP
jgi:hypothetical protein